MSDFDDDPTEEPAADPVDDAKSARTTAPDDDWDDDWDDGGDRGAKRDLTLVYAVVAAAIVIVLAIVLTRPKDDGGTTTASSGNGETTEQPAAIEKNWQGAVGDAVGENGSQAQARVEKAPGVYIWTDFQGFHVRSSLDKEVVVKVTAPKVRAKATDDYDDSDEKGDSPTSTEAVVTIAPGDPTTGAGFDLLDSETATFTITVDGQDLPKDQIFLGGAEGVADANPVQFTKA